MLRVVGHREVSAGVLHQLKRAGVPIPANDDENDDEGEAEYMTAQEYEVDVERDGRRWVLEIPELGAGGQARNLDEVEHEAQGVAAMWLDVVTEMISVRVTVHSPEAAGAE